MRLHGAWFLFAVLLCGCAAMRQSVREGLSTAGQEPWIRVGLSSDVSTFEMTSDQDMILTIRDAQGGRRRSPRQIGRELRIGPEGGIGLQGGHDYRETLPEGDTIVVDFQSHPLENRFAWNGRHYTGRMMVFRNARSGFNVVNVLPMERYLDGVVPAEIGGPANGSAEAVKAQAVAARTYTVYFFGRRASEGFDLFGTTEDQVYGGLESEKPAISALVAETRGKVLFSEGRPVRAMYSSNCGGMCASLDEAFPSSAESCLIPHRDRAPDQDPGSSFCSAASVYRWKEEWTVQEFEGLLARNGPADWRTEDGQLRGRVLDVRVGERSASGRVKRLDIETTTGVLQLDEMKIRATLRRHGDGDPILRSTLFKIAVDFDGDTPVKVVASGAGNGHGVGLCQYGARGMASAGYRHDQILLHYYRGAQLASLYP